MRITPVCYYTQKNTPKKTHTNFSSNLPSSQASRTIGLSFPIRQSLDLPWIQDKIFLKSISQLTNLQFNANDVKYIQSLGGILPFLNGKDAVSFIKNSHIDIKFADLLSKHIHAQYDFKNNCINVNKVYENTENPAEILAISEAILHEAGHARDYDGSSTIQEEIDCLALNALSHRALSRKFPDVFSTANSLIVQDGVCVYDDLFFDKDPLKARLISRLKQKYGNLPAGDFKHPPSDLALSVKNS